MVAGRKWNRKLEYLLASNKRWLGCQYISFKLRWKKTTLTIVQVVKNNKTYDFGGYATEIWDEPADWMSKFEICTLSYLLTILLNKSILLPHINSRVDPGGSYHFSEFEMCTLSHRFFLPSPFSPT